MSNIDQARIPWVEAGGRKSKLYEKHKQYYPGKDPLGKNWWEEIETPAGI